MALWSAFSWQVWYAAYFISILYVMCACIAMQPYAVLLAGGTSYVNFILLVGSTEADMLPWTVYLDGVPCKVSRLAQKH